MLFLPYSTKLLHAWTSNNSFFSCILKLAEVFAKDGMSFLASCQNLVSRPWVIDDLDAFKSKWAKKSWEKVFFYCCLILLLRVNLDATYSWMSAYKSLFCSCHPLSYVIAYFVMVSASQFMHRCTIHM